MRCCAWQQGNFIHKKYAFQMRTTGLDLPF